MLELIVQERNVFSVELLIVVGGVFEENLVSFDASVDCETVIYGLNSGIYFTFRDKMCRTRKE